MSEEEKKPLEFNNWLDDYADFNKELEARILEANNDSSLVRWSKLLPDLLKAEVFMAGVFGKDVIVDGERKMNLLMLMRAGHPIVPFFSSPQRMAVLVKDRKDVQFDVMKVSALRFFHSVQDDLPIVLNPFSEYTRAFTPFDRKVLVAEYGDQLIAESGADKSADNG